MALRIAPHRLRAIALGACALAAAHGGASAQGVIRDAEIEHTLRAIATPLLQAAGLSPSDVRLVIVNDRSLNAFVARGQNVFMHTGLLMRAESSSEIAGVLAHEFGHIAGGHLARLPEQLDNMGTQAFLALILGAAAAALSGEPALGAGVAGGVQDYALRNTLSYTRLEESSADQAGLRYLNAVGWSAEGFLSFMEILNRQESLLSNNQDPYMRTHPVTSERVSTIRGFVESRRGVARPLPPALQEAMARSRAKLIGYLDGRAAVGRYYPSYDQSVSARYARAVAAFRAGDLADARGLTAALAREQPNDPYFQEFLGDIALDGQDMRGAVDHYRLAVQRAPDATLIQFSLGRALSNIGDDAAAREAVEVFRRALTAEPENPRGWLDFSIALGRIGEIGRAALAHANYASLIGSHQLAIDKAELAQRELPAGDPARLRAADLIAASQIALRRQRNR